MKRFKITRDLGVDSILIPISIKSRDLGFISNPPVPNNKTKTYKTLIKYIGNSRLDECKSFNINEPYIVGVNGVKNINDNIITYTINDITYTTNIDNNETNIVLTTENNIYEGTNYSRETIGLSEEPVSEDLFVERGTLNIMENFFRLKNIKKLNDFNETGFGFYRIYNQTI